MTLQEWQMQQYLNSRQSSEPQGYDGFEGAVSMGGVPLWGVTQSPPPTAPPAVIQSARYPVPTSPQQTPTQNGAPPQAPQPPEPQYAPNRGGYIQDAGQPASRLTLRYTQDGEPVISGRDAANVPRWNTYPAESYSSQKTGQTPPAQPGMMPYTPPAGSPEFYYQVALKQGASPEKAMRFAQAHSGSYKAPEAPKNMEALAYAAAQGDPRAKAALESLKAQKGAGVGAAPTKEMEGGIYQWNPETRRYDIYAGKSKAMPEQGRNNVVLPTPKGYVIVNKVTGEQVNTNLNKPLTGGMIDTEQQLGTLKGTFDKVKSLYSPEYTGPVQGRLGQLASVTTGNEPDRATFLSAMQDINNAIVYLKSGKQINESEYTRLNKAMPTVNLADTDFKARMAEFDRVLNSIAEERAKAKKGWGETTPTSPQQTPSSTPPTAGARLAPNGKWYESINGQLMEVTP